MSQQIYIVPDRSPSPLPLFPQPVMKALQMAQQKSFPLNVLCWKTSSVNRWWSFPLYMWGFAGPKRKTTNNSGHSSDPKVPSPPLSVSAGFAQFSQILMTNQCRTTTIESLKTIRQERMQGCKLLAVVSSTLLFSPRQGTTTIESSNEPQKEEIRQTARCSLKYFTAIMATVYGESQAGQFNKSP